MYGPLLDRRNLLLVDQRGTGRSARDRLPDAAGPARPYDSAAQVCAAQLGDHSDLYGSTLSADDQSAVIRALQLGKVDLYGDSYGTFFTQVFAGRHPGQVRASSSTALTRQPARRSGIRPRRRRCARSFDHRVRTVAGLCVGRPARRWACCAGCCDQVRHTPYRGHRLRRRRHATSCCRQRRGAGCGGLRGDLRPGVLPRVHRRAALCPAWRPRAAASAGGRERRLLVECRGRCGPTARASTRRSRARTTRSFTTWPTRRRSAARSTHASVAGRSVRTRTSTRRSRSRSTCTRSGRRPTGAWTGPHRRRQHPAEPPAPPSGHYPSVPTLVLSGELDSITTPAEGALVTAEFPGARHV